MDFGPLGDLKNQNLHRKKEYKYNPPISIVNTNASFRILHLGHKTRWVDWTTDSASRHETPST